MGTQNPFSPGHQDIKGVASGEGRPVPAAPGLAPAVWGGVDKPSALGKGVWRGAPKDRGTDQRAGRVQISFETKRVESIRSPVDSGLSEKSPVNFN